MLTADLISKVPFNLGNRGPALDDKTDGRPENRISIAGNGCLRQLDIVDALCNGAKAIRDLKQRLFWAVEEGQLDAVGALRQEFDTLCAEVMADVSRLAEHRYEHGC